jgi:hypothetical protein
MPVGNITRGTTNTNRLRRVDRYLQVAPALLDTTDPLVIDLGYGHSASTSLELQHRLRRVRPDVEVLGLEIDPARVSLATRQLEAVHRGESHFQSDAAVSFARGGFEVPTPAGRRPAVIRAFNVLRQYDESQVADAWALMTSRLQPRGLLVEGTCDEIGRIASWVDVGADGPRSFTISLRLPGLERPSVVAERLPKALIHRNVEGERVHDLLVDLDRFWQYNAALDVHSPVQRWVATVAGLRDAGWPVLGRVKRWRLGEVTVPWAAVAPRD